MIIWWWSTGNRNGAIKWNKDNGLEETIGMMGGNEWDRQGMSGTYI